jgi:signal transduction histidine kinase
MLTMLVLALVSCTTKQNFEIKTESIPSIDTLVNNAGKISFYNPDLALKYLDSVTANKKLSLKEKIRYYGYISYLYSRHINKLDKALQYSDSMFYILEGKEIKDYAAEFSYSYFSRGDVLFSQKKFGEAYTYYFKGKQLGNVFFDSCAKAEYHYRLAHVLFLQKKYDESKLSFINALSLWKSCRIDFAKFFMRQEVLSNIGLCYQRTNQFDSALYYYNSSLKYISDNDSAFVERKELKAVAKGVIYGNIGFVFQSKNHLDSALFYYRKSIDINLHQGYEVEDALLNYIQIAEVYSMQNKLDSMYLTLKEIETQINKLPYQFELVLLRWNKQMWHYYNEKKQINKAYTYLTKYHELFEKQAAELKEINSIDITKQVDFLETKQAFGLLQKESEFNKVYFWGSVILITLISSIFIIILYYWTKSKRNFKTLKRLNDTIKHQNFSLETQSREKEKILKLVAHDLRTPIASILGLTDLLKNENDKHQQEELVNIMKMACNNSLQLISEILESTALANKFLEKEKVNANECLADCISHLKINAAEKKQHFVIKALSHPVNLYVNKDKMKRVMYNLITNAIKFSYEGSEIILSITQPNQKIILISIQDFGIGMPQEIQRHIFTEKENAKREGTKGEKSYGLGLTICKEIIEAHKGKIWVESEVGKGTIFFIELPVAGI